MVDRQVDWIAYLRGGGVAGNFLLVFLMKPFPGLKCDMLS
jgi:hypothetical protein